MSPLKRLRTLALAVLLPAGVSTILAIGTLLSAPTPAFAAPCQNDSCRGLDPQTTGCAASAYTVYQTLYGIYQGGNPQNALMGYVELRYSTQCLANWSRVTVGAVAPAESGSATIDNSTNGGSTVNDSQPTQYWDGYGGYSKMLGGSTYSDRANGNIGTPNGYGWGSSPWG